MVTYIFICKYHANNVQQERHFTTRAIDFGTAYAKADKKFKEYCKRFHYDFLSMYLVRSLQVKELNDGYLF